MSQYRLFKAFSHGLYRYFAMLIIAYVFLIPTASAQTIVMASTTSTEQSGLFTHLLPEFKKATGVEVKVVALGTGQALDMGSRGDADVLFVHDQAAEEKMVADGIAVKRFAVMYNDFVLIGPGADPAKTPPAPPPPRALPEKC